MLVRFHPRPQGSGYSPHTTDKQYTYHEKEVENGTIILYTHDTEDVYTTTTDFSKLTIEDQAGDRHREKVPFPPTVKSSSRTEETRISLETCKDFDITERNTTTLTYEDWSAVVDLPKDAALAYLQHFGDDKCRIE